MMKEDIRSLGTAFDAPVSAIEDVSLTKVADTSVKRHVQLMASNFIIRSFTFHNSCVHHLIIYLHNSLALTIHFKKRAVNQ